MLRDFNYAARMRDWIFDFEPFLHHFLDGALEASARLHHVRVILARKVNGPEGCNIERKFRALVDDVNSWEADHMSNRQLVKCVCVV